MVKRTGKTQQTQNDLKQAFWRIYAKKPIEKITVGEVCTLAGYNRGTFYLHFQDLYALLADIEEEVLAGMTECVSGCMARLARDSGKLSLIAACKDVVLYYERNKEYVSVLLGEGGDPSFVYRLKDNLKLIWREYVVGSDSGRSEQEIDLLLEYTLAGALFMISRWVGDPSAMPAHRFAHLVYDFAIKDVRARVVEANGT